MSIQSKYSLGMLVLLLCSTYMLMPYLVSDLAPKSGLSITEMSWSLGLANSLAAISLYLRPRSLKAGNLILVLLILFSISTLTLHLGLAYEKAFLFLVGVVLLRAVLLNFSDLNRQVHMQTNNETGTKRSLAIANVISNTISCSVPAMASLLILRFGEGSLTISAFTLSFLPCTFVLIRCKKGTSIFNKVEINSRKHKQAFFFRLRQYWHVYVIALVNGTIFAFIFSLLPLLIAQSIDTATFSATTLIGGYFTINSVVISLGSIPLLRWLEKRNISDVSVIVIASVASISSIFLLGLYDGQLWLLALSSLFMALGEIVFIPFLVTLISVGYPDRKESLLRDTTLISVSISAVISAPLAALISHFGYQGVLAFITIAGISVALSIFRIQEEVYGKSPCSGSH